jgi:hypothetical protein
VAADSLTIGFADLAEMIKGQYYNADMPFFSFAAAISASSAMPAQLSLYRSLSLSFENLFLSSLIKELFSLYNCKNINDNNDVKSSKAVNTEIITRAATKLMLVIYPDARNTAIPEAKLIIANMGSFFSNPISISSNSKNIE